MEHKKLNRYSSYVPCYNPEDIKENIKIYLETKDKYDETADTWYKGFTGKIEVIDENIFILQENIHKSKKLEIDLNGKMDARL